MCTRTAECVPRGIAPLVRGFTSPRVHYARTCVTESKCVRDVSVCLQCVRLVCVCVCEGAGGGERERECVCVCACVSERERAYVCVCR